MMIIAERYRFIGGPVAIRGEHHNTIRSERTQL